MSRVATGLLLVVLVLLTGCRKDQRELAPVADADAMCYAACTPSLTDTGFRWAIDPESPQAWDALGEEIVGGLAGALLQCERRRQACAGFIEDIKRRGVIRGAQPAPARRTGDQP